MKNCEMIKRLNVCRKHNFQYIGKVSRGANNLSKFNSRKKTFSSYQDRHWSYHEEAEKEIHKEDGKKAAYFGEVFTNGYKKMDLGLKPFQIQRPRLFSSLSNQRVTDKVFVCNEVRFFTVLVVVNYQLSERYGLHHVTINIPEGVRTYFRCCKRIGVMVLAAVTPDSKLLLVFSEERVKVNRRV